MIRETDILEAIAECQGEKNPNATTCRNLAAFYTILDHIREVPGVSHDNHAEVITYESDSEFSKAVRGRTLEQIMPVLDDLMETIQAMYPRMYDAVMRKLKEW